jgi:hypothetical protein
LLITSHTFETHPQNHIWTWSSHYKLSNGINGTFCAERKRNFWGSKVRQNSYSKYRQLDTSAPNSIEFGFQPHQCMPLIKIHRWWKNFRTRSSETRLMTGWIFLNMSGSKITTISWIKRNKNRLWTDKWLQILGHT